MRNRPLRFGCLLAIASLMVGCGGAGGEAEAPVTAPPLPEGRLQALGSSLESGRYLALDDIGRAEGRVAVTVLVVGRAANAIEGRHALQTKRETIDCATQIISSEVGGFFDQTGKLVETRILTADRPGRPAEFADAEAKVACDPKAGKGRVLSGWRSARRDVQAPPADLAQKVEAEPDDADARAWLCAAAARGAWRAQSLEDCDKAVALLPDDSAVKIDRGYLRLKVGREAQAEADFKAVMAKDPGSAAALFGYSLVPGMRGDMAASKLRRGPALDLDPKIADWVAATYRLPLSAEFRAR